MSEAACQHVSALRRLLLAAPPVRGEPETAARALSGDHPSLASSSGFRSQVQRFAFEHALLDPFVELWRAGRRPDAAAPARARHRLRPARQAAGLIGYQSGDCVIALLDDRAATPAGSVLRPRDRLDRLGSASSRTQSQGRPSWP